ncbi:hypothetical protein EXIGUO8H_120010 [Exiguobacterium sp. 8H]|uniref:hypothetical protein n=1 Tax=unclassified Exiguobacterium TaxID=2644629 RepID=UPI0012F0DF90|nr:MULTISPECIES: hypothetical protein [unclassified Exiguobacterium]VXB38276.1 hypothetical protein EXIGUO8H_120010 [Exiguobacterium sp. 8H]VXB99769.1 hypothetical protein EXIGUO8A_590009 [Exiguobacterium sp. 8A]
MNSRGVNIRLDRERHTHGETYYVYGVDSKDNEGPPGELVLGSFYDTFKPASLLFVAMPLLACYYRSRDAAGMWGAWAILGFYILFVIVAVYGFGAMKPYYRGIFDPYPEDM